MKVHREGLSIIFTTAGILLLINYLLFSCVWCPVFSLIFAVFSVVFFLIVVNFFRCPKRVFADLGTGVIVSPADGRVVVVEEVEEDEYFHDRRIQVSIFMSLLNAHVNWVPCAGRVVYYSYRAGRYQAAYLPKSSSENERSTVVIERPDGEKVLVRQIAGAMAKRIVTYVENGDECSINEQLGFIKFGSRVDLFLPLDAKIDVRLHDEVRGNRTVIAHL